MKPASLAKMADLEVKAFIEKCIADVSEWLSVKDLLMDPFLQSDYDNDSVGQSSRSQTHHSGNSSHNQSIANAEDNSVEPTREFTVEGQRRDNHTMFLKLRIADSSGNIHNIHFPFDIEADTSISVASEMVEELKLTDQDVTTIASMIDSEIRYHIPSWNFSETPVDINHQDSSCTSETRPEASPVKNDSIASPGSLALEILPSGRRYWSDSPRGVGGNSPSRHFTSILSNETGVNAEEGDLITNGDISADYCVDGTAERECDEIADSPSSEISITSGATSVKSSQKEISPKSERF